jgi:hypothetical protein
LATRTRHIYLVPRNASPPSADAVATGGSVNADGVVAPRDQVSPQQDLAFTGLGGTVPYEVVTRRETYVFDPVSLVDRSSLVAPAASSEQSPTSSSEDQQRVASRIRRLSRSARRSRGSFVGSDEVQLEWLGCVRSAASVAGVEDGLGGGGLGHEPAHAAALDARICERSLRRLLRGVGPLLRVRLVLT